MHKHQALMGGFVCDPLANKHRMRQGIQQNDHEIKNKDEDKCPIKLNLAIKYIDICS